MMSRSSFAVDRRGVETPASVTSIGLGLLNTEELGAIAMAAGDPFVTVVVPAYNEEAIIEQNVSEIVAYLDTIEHRYAWELVIVNDGSKDRTGELVDAIAAGDARVRALHHHTNFNLGQALRFAFNNARGRYIVVLDADLSYAPEHIGRMLDAAVESRAKIVIASPYADGGKTTAIPRFREFLSRGANRLLGMSAKGDLSTITGMVRCYDRRFIQSLSLKSNDIEINTEIIYKAQMMRARIIEIPAHLDWTEQMKMVAQRGSSLRMGRSIGAQAFSSFLFRPFMFFILPGLIVLMAALYTLAWVMYHVIEHYRDIEGSFDPRLSQALAEAFAESPHSFIIGGIALLIAVQLISLGIVAAQAKRYFEEGFYQGTMIYRQVRMPDLLSGADRRELDQVAEAVAQGPVGEA